MDEKQDELVFLHFNDVYHVNQPKILARFAHDFRSKKKSLSVFSGDALGPSLESSILKGEHIIPILNPLNIDVACYGNHDFDFGENRLKELSALCNFPYLLSNAFHPEGTLLASAKEFIILEHAGYRLGFFGLAGTDWPSNCQHLPPETVIASPVETARRLSRMLKEQEHVDLVVAITHMRLEEDLLVSDHCSEVDLILGGHDHDLVVHGDRVTVVNDDAQGNIRIVKSGTDFRSYSIVRLAVSRHQGRSQIDTVRVHHERDLSLSPKHPEDPEIHTLVSAVQEKVASVSNKPLFRAGCPLDGRTAQIRSFETNLGNLLADVVRAYYNTDIAFVNSGSIRCDRVVPEGVLTVRDLVDILPFGNVFVVKRIPAHSLFRALENSVSDSRTDGRFLQISGISIAVDFRRPEGARIQRVAFHSPNQEDRPIQPDSEETFTVAMVSFIAEGFDGYTCFTDSDVETLVGMEGAMTDTGIMLEILREDEQLDSHIERSRKAIFVGVEENLPIVKPEIDGRIEIA